LTRRGRGLILLLYGVSGGVGLAWQVLWVRAFTPIFGVGLEAIAAVTASFMAGLAVGAVLAPRLLRRWGGLGSYARLELAVGIWGAALPWLLLLLAEPLVAMLASTGEGWLASLLRLSVASLLVGIPAAGLGATFPAVVAALRARDDPARVGLAYGLNALGAALGSLLAGLWLPFALGLRRGSLLLGGLGLAVGLAAWWLDRSEQADGSAPQPHGRPDRAEATVPGSLWALAALTGFTGLALEVSWSRLSAPVLARILGPGEQAFACVLAAVLLGIGLGGVLGRSSSMRAGRMLALLQLGLAATALATLEPVRALYLGAELVPLVEASLPLVPALFLGATFPLLSNELLAWGGDARAVGRLYAVNTAGAVLGSLLSGFLAIPQLGAQRWAVLMVGLVLLTALIGLLRDGARLAGALLAAAAIAALALALIFVPPVAGQRLATGVEQVVAALEGREATTLVVQDRRGDRTLISGGHRIRDGRGGEVNDHARRALVPTALHPRPRRVLAIGLGTGETARTFLDLDGVEELLVVELDERQPELLSWFGTGHILEDPRLELVTGDGRHLLRTRRETWDLIVVDAYGPEATPAFYSADFFGEARARLAPGGLLFVKLMPSALPDADTLASFLCTLFDSFPWSIFTYYDDGLSGLVGAHEAPVGALRADRIGAAAGSSDTLCDGVRLITDDRSAWLAPPDRPRPPGVLMDPWWYAQGHESDPPWRRDAERRQKQRGHRSK